MKTKRIRRNGSAVAATHQSPNREITLTLSPALSGVLDDYAGSWGIKIEELCEWLVFNMAQAGTEESEKPLTASALVSKGARSKERRMNPPIKSIHQVEAVPAASPPAATLAPPAEILFGAIDALSNSIRDLTAVMDLGERYLDDHDERRVSEEEAGDMTSSFRSLMWHVRGKVEFDLITLKKAWEALKASAPQCLETKADSQEGAR